MNDWARELRENPRLQLGLAVVVGLLWVLGLLELADRLDAARTERTRLADDLARLGSVAEGARWPRLRDDAQQRLADYRALAWREESEGRMQAAMQDWLREQFAALGVQPRELVVSVLPAAAAPAGQVAAESSAGTLPPEMRVVRARATFEFDPQRLHRLLAALPESRRWTWVSRLSVDHGTRRLVELELGALFVLGVKGAA